MKKRFFSTIIVVLAMFLFACSSEYKQEQEQLKTKLEKMKKEQLLLQAQININILLAESEDSERVTGSQVATFPLKAIEALASEKLMKDIVFAVYREERVARFGEGDYVGGYSQYEEVPSWGSKLILEGDYFYGFSFKQSNIKFRTITVQLPTRYRSSQGMNGFLLLGFRQQYYDYGERSSSSIETIEWVNNWSGNIQNLIKKEGFLDTLDAVMF